MIEKLISTTFAFLLAAGPAMAQQQGYRYEHGHMFSGDGWGYMFMGPVFLIIVIALAVLLVVLALRWFGGDHHQSGGRSRDEAMDVLRARFAKGEIDAEEFEARRRMLDGS